MSKRKILTIKFEVPDSHIPDLRDLKRDGALDDLAECVATLEGRRVVGVIFSD